ncbi:FG-GAP repeat domain-containing protein [Marinicella sediminis]|uniref:FG-GAP repeat domain-containing protein n=1 Tax=Marinicella sediminis TaxID=1792834 RepID=A0ABV7JG19_9GAMM|nr:VCBS repeat-containing protein [Marinicella sediminis]
MKKLLYWGCMLLFAEPVLSIQYQRSGHDVLTYVHGPSQLGIVDTRPIDIDQDGDMDLVSLSFEDGSLRGYLNDGQMNFSQLMISEDTPGALRFSAYHDQGWHFIIPSVQTDQIHLIEPFDDGYRKTLVTDQVFLPIDAQAHDFDGDGDFEVMSLSFQNDAVYLSQKDQAGSQYQTRQIVNNISQPRMLLVADFNQDELPDVLVSASGTNDVWLLENQGALNFQAVPIDQHFPGANELALCDINQDEKQDFVVYTSANEQLLGMVNLGGGQFQKIEIGSLIAVNGIHCANINDDPAEEVLITVGGLGQVISYEPISNAQSTLHANLRDGYVSVHVAALSESAEPWIITQSFFSQRVLLYDPGQLNQEVVVWEDYPEGANAVVNGDLNKDGAIDSVAASFRSHQVIVYDGLDHAKHYIDTNARGAAKVLLADLNDDRLPDVVAAATNDNSIYWYQNHGEFQFTRHLIDDQLTAVNDIALADLNQDGQIDVVAISSATNEVYWYEQAADHFIRHLVSDQTDAPVAVAASDFTGDQLPDLLVLNFFTGRVDVFENNGSGSFSRFIVAENLARPYDIEVAELAGLQQKGVFISESGGNSVYQGVLTAGGLVLTEIISTVTRPRALSYDSVADVLRVGAPFVDLLYQINDPFRMPSLDPDELSVLGISDVSVFNTAVNGTNRQSVSVITAFDENAVIKIRHNDVVFYNGAEK